MKIQQHRFEIYTLVANIEDSIDMVLGMKNMHELEAEHSSRHSEFRIMNRAIPMFPMDNFTLKPGNKRFIKFIVPFFSNLHRHSNSETDHRFHSYHCSMYLKK